MPAKLKKNYSINMVMFGFYIPHLSPLYQNDRAFTENVIGINRDDFPKSFIFKSELNCGLVLECI